MLLSHSVGDYTYHAELSTKAEASASCKARGRTLATPRSQAEIDVIKGKFSTQIGRKQVYTGLTKADVPTSLWYPREPSGDGSCIGLNLRGSWQFNDLPCGVKLGFVCQSSGN